MKTIQKIGLFIFLGALAIFTASLGLSKHQLNADNLSVTNEYHKKAILEAATNQGLLGNSTSLSNIAFIKQLRQSMFNAQTALNESFSKNPPEGIPEWDYKLGDWKIGDYVFQTVKASSTGLLPNNRNLFFFLTFGMALIGGLLFILPKFLQAPGIKNDGIYHSSLTRGLTFGPRAVFIGATILGVLLYGWFYMDGKLFWPILTLVVITIIIFLVLYKEKQNSLSPAKSASPNVTASLGIFSGIYLIGFYILLYWAPEYMTNWILLVDPISEFLSGNPASQWFLYGFLYSIIVLVMGIRMISKYRHNKYQIVRTFSVMFFQTCFAFILPEILIRLNQPYFDFKNIWPLDYDFFFDWNINNLINSGGLGIFMLVWGITLTVLGVPIITYFFGKRWYCSWVCGCGGLAETMGDPFRQLSDKSLRAWKYERYIIHGVLVFAVFMTLMVLYSYFTGSRDILFFNSDVVRKWYGFLIGSAFAGIVGTGFYPLMGNRTWCRFGCPLAAYLGLIQKYKSRFRITTNGGQCISCGNCSTYCEMGIDVRHYAQRGQDIVRSSCVGCGVCSAVCPRGVLRLENGSTDISQRATELRTIHISESEVKILA